MDAAQLRIVKDKLVKTIDAELDSLRFYELGNNYKSKVEHYGAKPSFDVTNPLIV
jgi:CRISPR-associated protein Cas2